MRGHLLALWLTLVRSFSVVCRAEGTEEDKVILDKSVPYLLQTYRGTLGSGDRAAFGILELYARLGVGLEKMPLFGPKSLEPVVANPLYAHSIRANALLASLQAPKAFQTGMRLEEGDLEGDAPLPQFYDLRFLLPLLAHALAENNICDPMKVISHGWIHLMMRGLALNDPTLRNIALLAFKRLLFNLQLTKGYRLQDVKMWLHLLEGVKGGLAALGSTRVSRLVGTWVVGAGEVLKEPGHPMYPAVTHFLLAKPTLDLSLLPDFIPFYNDRNKESREWILEILGRGLVGVEDWRVAQRLPVIKFLCLSFPTESIGSQRRILGILCGGAGHPEIAEDMVGKHGLPLWMANIPLTPNTYFRRELEDVFKNLLAACPPTPHSLKLLHFVAAKHGWPYPAKEQ